MQMECRRQGNALSLSLARSTLISVPRFWTLRRLNNEVRAVDRLQPLFQVRRRQREHALLRGSWQTRACL